ncbi:MAG: asparagine synthetase B family protein, partial [Flavobacteriaceae bacterium]|nr:asparagine synthetase B family protein [Flavobacteriaceae bacterium]
MKIKTAIIPAKPNLANVKNDHVLDHKAICVFSAIGFFLDDDTYWKDKKVIRPGSNAQFDENGMLVNEQSWFEWHHKPKSISFDKTVDDFAELFEGIVEEQTYGKNVILPLSGGLDSRTQAAALRRLGSEVSSYSYAFRGGYPESKIAEQIAARCGFDFQSFTIEEGYLWD